MSGFFIRLFDLLFFPSKEWNTISEENHSRKTVYIQFVVPFLCFITLATIIGTWTTQGVDEPKYIICEIAILWTSLSAGLFVSAYLVTEIMAQQLRKRNHNRDFALMAYSSCAAYIIIIIVALFPFPFLRLLLVLGFYSYYLYWTGMPYIVQVEDRERTFYGLLSLVIMIITYMLLFFLFGNTFRELFGINE